MKHLHHLLLLPFLLVSTVFLSAEEPNTFTREEISETAALELTRAAIAEARKRDEVIAVAVTDLGGHLIAFLRMDEAKPAVVQIAIGKAYSSSIYRATTGKLWEISQPGEPAFGLQTHPGTITFQGGVPIMKDGQVIGGLGVSGAAAHVDGEIAHAAAEQVFGAQSVGE